jgi:hypothetical protein
MSLVGGRAQQTKVVVNFLVLKVDGYILTFSIIIQASKNDK